MVVGTRCNRLFIEGDIYHVGIGISDCIKWRIGTPPPRPPLLDVWLRPWNATQMKYVRNEII